MTSVTRGRLWAAILGAVLSTTAAAQAPLFRELGTELPGLDNHVASVDADFDLDGDRDLAVLVFGVSPPAIRLLGNDGSGRFTNGGSAAIPTALQEVRSLRAGDFDGDGVPDVFLAYTDVFGAALGAVYLSTQSGFTLAASFPVAGVCLGCPFLAFVRDFDGDGLADVAIAHDSSPPSLLMNSNGLNFTAAAAGMSSLPLGTLLLDCGDADGDGDADLFATQPVSGTVWRLQNNAGLMTIGPAFAPASFATYWQFGLGEFDGDGFVDVVVAPAAAAGAESYLSFALGAPSVLASVVRATPAYGVRGFDFDGDGVDEVQRFGLASMTIEARGAATVLAAYPIVSAVPALVFDVDGDGDRDVLVRDRAGDRFLRRAGTGFVDASEGPPLGTFSWNDAIAGDFDGDGATDFLSTGLPHPTTGNYGGHRRVSFNDGRGRFVAGTVQPENGPPGLVQVVGDFDGDGDDDVVHFDMGVAKVMTADGAGGFSDSAFGLPGASSPVVAAVVSDLDLDGAIDIVVARGAPANDVLWIRNQTPAGPAIIQIPFNGGASVVTDLAAADLDNDLDDDLVVGCVGGSSALIANLGGGAFSASFPAGFTSASSVAIGDLDGIGELDVLLDDQVLLQFGGLFANGPTTGLSLTTHPGVRRLVDLNGDGLSDLVATFEVRLAVGGGSFAPGQTIRARRWTGAGEPNPWSWADLDRDGDLDLFDGAGALYWNASVQLHQRSTIGLGRTATFEIYGPAGAYFELFGSLGAPAGDPVLPGWGRLGIDPASAFLATVGTFDAAGKATIQFAVPSSTGLNGFEIYWQAAIPSLPRLTGAMKTTLRSL